MDRDLEWMGIAAAMIASSRLNRTSQEAPQAGRKTRGTAAPPSGKRAAVKAARRQSRQQRSGKP